MSATTTLPRIDERLAGALAVLVAAAALAPANFGASPGENGGAAEYAVSVGLCAVLAGILFGIVLPRAERPARAAAWCAGLGVLSLAVFWSGLPFVLGAGAIFAASRAGVRMPALVGALVIAAAVVGCLVG